MKYLFLSLITLFLSVNLYGKNPVYSPTFDDIIKEIIGDEKYVFDDKYIELSVPNFADNATQVPISVDGKKIKNAKRMILFADLNPIPKIVDMDLNKLLPLISVNIKVAQETPIRALILDEENIWHIASKNIRSFGGGCDVSSQASNSNSDFAKYLGQTKSNLFQKDNVKRLKASIFHPMETGLIFGNNPFYITKILVKNGNEILSEIKTYSAISENPRFIFETKDIAENYTIEFYDNDGNEFVSEAK
jgi:sulfur-oxidizing protein SoxY